MNRRESLKTTGLAVGQFTLAPTFISLFFQKCSQIKDKKIEWMPAFIPPDCVVTLLNVIDHIIPETDSPSGTEALVHVFIDLYVRDCYAEQEQKVFLDGLEELRNSGFDDKSVTEQRKDLIQLEEANMRDDHFIRRVKQLTLLGYFTSKEGAMKAAHYIPYHGAYEGCVTIDKTQKVQAI